MGGIDTGNYRLVDNFDKDSLKIPAQYRDLNSFQLQVVFIDSEINIRPSEREEKQKIVNRLIKIEQSRLRLELKGTKDFLSIYKEDFEKYSFEINKAFIEFILSGDVLSLTGITDLEYYYLRFLAGKNMNDNILALSSDQIGLLDTLWEIIYYRFSLKFLRDGKNKKNTDTDNTKIEEIRTGLQLESKNEISDEEYGEFSEKNGETDEGTFWYEHNNTACKKLKEKGDFKWGEYRIYFEIPFNKIELLKKITMLIAANGKIAIGFKYLDVEKSHSSDTSDNSKTTRFVTNFSSVDDAIKFYEILSKIKVYTDIKPDRNIDYLGYKLDNKATFSSGYREQREALERIKKATKNPDGSYTYTSESGKMITITNKMFHEITQKGLLIVTPEEIWNKKAS